MSCCIPSQRLIGKRGTFTSTLAPGHHTAYLQKGQAGQVDGEGSSESTLLQPYYRDKQMPEDSNTNMGKEGGEGDGEPEKEAVGEGEKKESEGAEEEDVFLPVDRPVQKNKKRCWVCKAKLELAQRELGGCKCGEWGQLGGWLGCGCLLCSGTFPGAL